MTVDHLIAQSTPHPPAALAGTLVGSAAVPDAVAALPLRLTCLSRTAGLVHLHASARDHTAEQSGFVRAARRIIRLVLEEALAVRRHEPHLVRTPLGATFAGATPRAPQLTAVSVPRAGDAMEHELREIVPDTRFGKILIQRDPVTTQPQLFYAKLPRLTRGHDVILLDPMMATSGTVQLALSTLLDAGVLLEDVILANVLTCPSALERLAQAAPGLRVVTSFVDERLTDQAFMHPGIGDFGDRFYGTTA
ncbi:MULTISPECIES: uracil phosphoribosyltransferase [Aeromicrobium]|jgi:uracil phosphoribosyltransferase|uniref:uracil phosphoribosyltransferase n=1 Tax=Aeromicrobium TaxID=2040 RepID=UPI00082A4967|nr:MULTISPECIES: uracil phosphoribosyltransferase [Aeromicrobium]